jgi:hypothetical protein
MIARIPMTINGIRLGQLPKSLPNTNFCQRAVNPAQYLLKITAHDPRTKAKILIVSESIFVLFFPD